MRTNPTSEDISYTQTTLSGAGLYQKCTTKLDASKEISSESDSSISDENAPKQDINKSKRIKKLTDLNPTKMKYQIK